MLAAKKAKPFHWFQGQSVVDLVNAIGEYGGPSIAIVEVHTEAGPTLKESKMHFSVHAPGSADGTVVNNSHICPIDCP